MNSKGSLGYAGGFEYFVDRMDDVYRTDYANEIEATGFRSSSRFFCTKAAFPTFLKAYKIVLHDENGNLKENKNGN